MNWDAIGAIAELLGAIGVIASLVYLATQIRQSREHMSQNTRATRAATYQEFNHQLHQTMLTVLMVPGLSKIARLGMIDLGQLDEDEAYAFTFWLNGVMRAYDNAYYQRRVGMLDDDRWEAHRADLVLLLDAPGIVRWWNTYIGGAAPRDRLGGRTNYSPGFVALVEEILGGDSQRADD